MNDELRMSNDQRKRIFRGQLTSRRWRVPPFTVGVAPPKRSMSKPGRPLCAAFRLDWPTRFKKTGAGQSSCCLFRGVNLHVRAFVARVSAGDQPLPVGASSFAQSPIAAIDCLLNRENEFDLASNGFDSPALWRLPCHRQGVKSRICADLDLPGGRPSQNWSEMPLRSR